MDLILSSWTGVKPIAVLYGVYFVFLLSVFGRSNDSAIGEYLATLIEMSLMLGALAASKRHMKFKAWWFLLLIFTLGFSFLLTLKGQSHYTILLYLKITLMMYFLASVNISRAKFIEFVNRTYLLYLTVSVLVWWGVIPNIFYTPNYDYADSHTELLWFEFNILFGIEGSPAAIDTYSAVVLLLNLFLNDGSSRKLYMLAAVFGIMASFRMTPIVAIIAVLMMRPVYSSGRVFASMLLLMIAIIFVLFVWALYFDKSINIMGLEVDLRLLAYAATHARSMIWTQQLEIMVENYTLLDYVFGRFSVAEFTVPTYQMEGAEAGGDSLNPHNNYLLLFFRSPFLFVLFALIFFVAQLASYSKNTFPVIFLIFLAAFTNSSLIGLGNPIYLLCLIYFMLEKSGVHRSHFIGYSNTTIRETSRLA